MNDDAVDKDQVSREAAIADELAALLVGLKPAQWSRIVVAVEKTYSSIYCKTQLPDADTIAKQIKLEAL